MCLLQRGARALGLAEPGVRLSQAEQRARHAARVLAAAEIGERLAGHGDRVIEAPLSEPDPCEVDQRIAGVERHATIEYRSVSDLKSLRGP